MSGAGASPAGSGSVAGYGVLPTATLANPLLYRGADGQQYGSAELGLGQDNRGQYVYDADGNKRGMSDVRQLVILAVQTELGSAADTALGRDLMPAKVSSTIVEDVTANWTLALKHLVDSGVVQINSITVEPGDGMPLATRIELVDLTTQQPIELTV